MFTRRTSWDLTTNRYTAAIESHRRTGRELLDLTASNPTCIGLSYHRSGLLSALANPESLAYEPVAKGLPSARAAIVNYYLELGIALDPEDLILTTSTSEAYTFSFRLLCEPGDEVLVPTPSYPLFEFLADLQDVRLVPYGLVYDHGWQIDFHSLQQKLTPRSRALIVVHPNNPTGSFVKAHEASQLAHLCAEREMAIIADEVFFDYSLAGTHQSFTGNHSCLTLTLSGLSKISGLPQMKVAWIAISGPHDVARQALSRLEVIADTYLSMNAPIQHAIPAMLEERRSIQQQLNHRLRKNLQALDRQLVGQSVSRFVVEGGWYAILRVPVLRSDEDLAMDLLSRCDVLVQPGHFYDFASDGYLVLSLITPELVFQEGVRRIIEAISTPS